MLLRHLKPNHAKHQTAISYATVTLARRVSQGERGTLAPAVKKSSSTIAASYNDDWGLGTQGFLILITVPLLSPSGSAFADGS